VTVYNVGDLVTITTTLTDLTGTPTNSTMALVVTKPDGTTTGPTITNPGTGLYAANVTADQAGTWLYTWTASVVLVKIDEGQFTVGSPAPLLYATSAELKARLNITDTARDAEIRDALEAASRDVEQDTGRVFYLATGTSARIYNPRNRQFSTAEGMKLLIDDIGSTNGLLVEVGTASTGYSTITGWEYGPDNALARGQAITWLLRTYIPWTYYPLQRVRVTAQWGWPAVPAQIKQATLIRAARLFKRRESPDGTVGAGDFGVIRVGRYDPDYDGLIAPFVIPAFG
jgi:hypothetical protein